LIVFSNVLITVCPDILPQKYKKVGQKGGQRGKSALGIGVMVLIVFSNDFRNFLTQNLQNNWFVDQKPIAVLIFTSFFKTSKTKQTP